MPEPEGGEQKYMILGLGLINCKNQESWLVVLREDAMSQLVHL